MIKYNIIKYANNTRYYLDGLLHREDGPAIEWTDGTKEWYKNGLLHREDGPAKQCTNGYKSWYFNDKCYGTVDDFTNESWKRFIKTLIFY